MRAGIGMNDFIQLEPVVFTGMPAPDCMTGAEILRQ
jgi:hypothetical protein